MSGKRKRGQSLENTGLAPFLKYLQETHRTHFRLQKRQTIKVAQKGTEAKAAPYLFVFGHIRSVFLLTSAKAGFGSAEDASRSGRMLLTDMRWETNILKSIRADAFFRLYRFLGLWRIQSELCASFSARSAVMSDSTISSIPPLRKDSMAYSVSPMRWSVTRPCGKL